METQEGSADDYSLRLCASAGVSMLKRETAPQSDNEKHLNALSRTYWKPLRAFFRRRVHSEQEAEDLVQELFLRIIRRQNVEGIVNPEAFLFRTAVNLLRDRGRRGKSSRACLDEISYLTSENFEVLSPERVLRSKQSLDRIIQALEKLRPVVRDVFVLARLEGMAHRDIAGLYGLSESTIEKYIVKADSYLQKYCKKYKDIS